VAILDLEQVEKKLSGKLTVNLVVCEKWSLKYNIWVV